MLALARGTSIRWIQMQAVLQVMMELPLMVAPRAANRASIPGRSVISPSQCVNRTSSNPACYHRRPTAHQTFLGAFCGLFCFSSVHSAIDPVNLGKAEATR